MRRRERGMAMVYVAILLVVATVVVGVGADRVIRTFADSSLEQAQVRAVHAADGGLAFARVELARDAGFTGAVVDVDGVSVEVVVTPQDGGWTVTTSARQGTTRGEIVRHVDATLGEVSGVGTLPRVTSYHQR